MIHRHLTAELCSAALLLIGAAGLRAQQTTTPTAKAVTGTYAAGTQRSFSTARDGCWLEVAPVGADSVRLQIRCQKPAPGHHIGAMDARRPFDHGKVVYETDKFVGHCRIVVTFSPDRAVVSHDATGANPDSACGFGAYVDVSGTYHRLSARRPRFELAPVERSSAPQRR
jgi:hypothetical protein